MTEEASMPMFPGEAATAIADRLVSPAATRIASHAPGAPSDALGPYAVDNRPELMIVPLVSGDSLLGGMLLAGKRGTAILSSPAERISAGSIGSIAAQGLEIAALRQRQDFSI